MLFDAHAHGFRVLGGIPERGIYDNMKTAVDKVSRGKERQINRHFQVMASHYFFEPEFRVSQQAPSTHIVLLTESDLWVNP
jgi:transposase